MALSLHELFDAEFLTSLQHLRFIAKRVPRGGRFAEQRSKALGSGLEFSDYRAYVPGDELRAIDWNLYRRHGRVFLRLFEEFEDLPVYLLPDVSASMWQEDPPRAHSALRAALAFAVIALGQHDRVGVFPFGGELETLVRPSSGRNRLMSLAQQLCRVSPHPHTDFARSLKKFNGMQMRRGFCVLLSDFFDPAGIEAVQNSLREVRHRLLLVRLTRATDRDPQLQGDLRLQDCETGDFQDVSVSANVLSKYREAYDRFYGQLDVFCRKRDIGILNLDANADIVPQLAALLEGGRFEA